MNEAQNPAGRPLAPDAVAEEDARYSGVFIAAEWRRLVFLRWLYRTGRLTEWP
jgi:hypothetical protein